MRRLQIRIWLSIALFVGLPGVAECVILNQVDTFQGSLNGWTDGFGGSNVLNIANGGPNGAGDGYLQVSSSGTLGTAASRMITFNQTQWKGNFVAAGVGSISMQLKNFGTSTLPMRIAIRDATGGQAVPGYASTNAFMLPADGQWHLAQFNLSTMTPVGTGLPPLATELAGVMDFRLLSATAPAVIGDTINARIGVDLITALPNAWTGASGTNWSDTGNWTGFVPGSTGSTTNTDTATFNRNATNSPLTIDAGRNLKNITFDTATASPMTIGTTAGPALLLTAAGTIQTTSTVASAETINAPLVLEGNYTFTSGANSALAPLTFGGAMSPPTTTGVFTLTLNGVNTSANNVKGVLSDRGAARLAVSKSGAGLWILSGADTYSGGTTVSAGTLEFDTAPTIANNSTFTVNGGTLRFRVSVGATVGTGVTATVASGATLELAGSASALASGANRANINNASATPAGVVVAGTNQVVGKVDGTGNTQVNTGGSLTASHVIQAALVIGGTAASHGKMTIAASNATGNPLIEQSDTSLGPGSSTSLFSTISLPPAPLFSGGLSSSFDSIAGGSQRSVASGTSMLGGRQTAVPEPSGLLLLALGGLAFAGRFAGRVRNKRERMG